jgi:hypothetical protein
MSIFALKYHNNQKTYSSKQKNISQQRRKIHIMKICGHEVDNKKQFIKFQAFMERRNGLDMSDLRKQKYFTHSSRRTLVQREVYFLLEFYLQGCNAMYSVKSQPDFRMSMLPPSSMSEMREAGSQHEAGSKRRFVCHALHRVITHKTGIFLTTAVTTPNPVE